MLTPREKCCKSFFLQVKKKRDVNITLAQADAHQQRQFEKGAIKQRGFAPLQTTTHTITADTNRRDRKLRVGTRAKTLVEREFEVMLSVKKMNKQIIDFRFEGVRLPWGDGMLFKADFAVKHLDDSITLIEVKGEHIWKHAIVRFKGCRAEWKEWFKFEFHQRTSDGLWHQLV